MDLPNSTIDPTSALSVQLTPVFSDNVQNLLGVGTVPKNPSAIITVNSTADVVNDSDGVTPPPTSVGFLVTSMVDLILVRLSFLRKVTCCFPDKVAFTSRS